jgi:hypothetical protein
MALLLMKQITTCSFFKMEGFSNKWWAFKQMRSTAAKLKLVNGLTFCKLLGSGGNNGFGAMPNFGAYVLLCVWNSESSASEFFIKNPFFIRYCSNSSEQFTVYAKTAESHGYWNKLQPFIKTTVLTLDMPVLVLTRARIRFKKLLSFWRKVGNVSQSLCGSKGLILSIGIGEWPLIEQATLSIWQTQAQMLDFAYKNKQHKEVVILTRKLDWFKEELFARFIPYKFEGFWNGKNVVNILEG